MFVVASLLAVASLAPSAAWAKRCFNNAHLLEARLRDPRFSQDRLVQSLNAIQRLDRYAELDPDRCVRGVTALAARLLDDDSMDVRLFAAQALQYAGPPAAPALPALRAALQRAPCACRDGACRWSDDGPGVSIAVAIATITGDFDQPGVLDCQPTGAPASSR